PRARARCSFRVPPARSRRPSLRRGIGVAPGCLDPARTPRRGHARRDRVVPDEIAGHGTDRLRSVFAAVCALAAIAVPTASAGSLAGVLQAPVGTVLGTASACQGRVLSQPFAPWGD